MIIEKMTDYSGQNQNQQEKNKLLVSKVWPTFHTNLKKKSLVKNLYKTYH